MSIQRIFTAAIADILANGQKTIDEICRETLRRGLRVEAEGNLAQLSEGNRHAVAAATTLYSMGCIPQPETQQQRDVLAVEARDRGFSNWPDGVDAGRRVFCSIRWKRGPHEVIFEEAAT